MRGFGYLISIVSVLLLGLVAWPRPDEPAWKVTALLAGMALSVAGMAFRWLASHQQKSELRTVEREVGIGQPAK